MLWYHAVAPVLLAQVPGVMDLLSSTPLLGDGGAFLPHTMWN